MRSRNRKVGVSYTRSNDRPTQWLPADAVRTAGAVGNGGVTIRRTDAATTMTPILLAYRDVLASSLLLTIVFFVVEKLRPAEPFQTVSDRVGNVLYLPFVTAWAFALQVLLQPLYAFAIHLARGGVWSRLYQARTSLLTQLLLTIAFAVLWDVWQYWIHRWQHSSAFLWETHKFHHSDTALNGSSQARHHALSYVVYMVSYAPMLLLFGTFVPHIVVTVLMFRLWGFVNHANVRIGFGPLTSLIAGPQWHRIHHSILPEHRDVNFAALFPFIDRLFHTYYKPGRDEYPRTGLPSNGETSLRQATISPLIGWYDAVRRVMRRSRAGASDPPNSQPAL